MVSRMFSLIIIFLKFYLPVVLVLVQSVQVPVKPHLHEQEDCMEQRRVPCLCRHEPVRWMGMEGYRDQHNQMEPNSNHLENR